jgi:hypothetical protein
MALTTEQKAIVSDTVDSEGFDYAFRHYSDFAEIDDPEFHRLRTAYCDAAKALAAYIGEEKD